MRYVKTALPVLLGLAVSGSMLYRGVPEKTAAMALVVIWMAGWWITEAVHLAVTALLPLLLYPLLGIMDMKDCSQQYMEQTIFLFMGGFFIGFALQKWDLHHWFSGRLIRFTGHTPGRLLLGVMVSSFFLSMWISNTAATLLLLSVVSGFCHPGRPGLNTALLLGLTYAATIGGMASLVGSPTNLVLPAFYDQTMPDNAGITFSRWLGVGFPFALILLVGCWGLLYFLFLRQQKTEIIATASRVILGANQRRVLSLFLLTALLWIFRSPIDLGFYQIRGWAETLTYGEYIKDSTIAIGVSLLMFLWPAKSTCGNLLEWQDVEKLPLDVLLLFGGGFALSAGFQESGLNAWLGTHLTGISGLPFPVFILLIALFTTVLSEFASNVATVQLVLPIVYPLAISGKEDPFYVLMAVSLASSFGFMMPIATAPNTLVYSTGWIRNRDMIRAGIGINGMAIGWLVVWIWWLGSK